MADQTLANVNTEPMDTPQDMIELDEMSGIKHEEKFSDPEELYKQLIDTIHKYHPSTDISMVEKAYHMADDAHKGQLRKSGEPYIIHPLSVAIILAELELDKETIVAGILHDVAEDTETGLDTIAEEFSDEIAALVDGVTKLDHLSYKADNTDVQAENLRKMFLAMAKDIRVIMIKLADRLHNMRTLQFQSPAKQIEKARETMDIYAPLARRLGISKIKVELDDLALKYLEPEAYFNLVKTIAQKKQERDDYVNHLADQVRTLIDGAGIEAEIYGRAKHFFSIYKKMVNQNKTLDQIYDLFAIRIIVKTVRDCYAALGVVHEHFTPIPGRFKDYIAMPKQNMYQSIHTTLIGDGGTPFEVQIRTEEMHRTSEYGIAAHWKYKESGEGATVNAEEQKLSWLRQILEWQQDMSDNKEFLDLLKNDLDLFSDTVFCFTPTGDIKNLPVGSTPIDFAYAIHSAVGNKMIGAKVNGKLVTIDYVIQNGDRVDIITSQNSKGPSRDWLNIVKSTQAKNKINQWFRNESKDENIQHGKDLLTQVAKAKGVNIHDYIKPSYQEKVLRKYGFHDWDNCLASIGRGAIKEAVVLGRLIEEYNREHPTVITDEQVVENIETIAVKEAEKKPDRHVKSKSGIIIKGMDDVAVRLSKCCAPVPGDEIVGFVTRGRGVTVHRTDCINVVSLNDFDRARLIDAEWDSPENVVNGVFLCEIRIFGNNRTGLLVDISRVFTEKNIDIRGIHSVTSKQEIATISVSFDVKNTDEINGVMDKIRQIEGIIDIERTRG